MSNKQYYHLKYHSMHSKLDQNEFLSLSTKAVA